MATRRDEVVRDMLCLIGGYTLLIANESLKPITYAPAQLWVAIMSQGPAHS